MPHDPDATNIDRVCRYFSVCTPAGVSHTMVQVTRQLLAILLKVKSPSLFQHVKDLHLYELVIHAYRRVCRSKVLDDFMGSVSLRNEIPNKSNVPSFVAFWVALLLTDRRLAHLEDFEKLSIKLLKSRPYTHAHYKTLFACVRKYTTLHSFQVLWFILTPLTREFRLTRYLSTACTYGIIIVSFWRC